MYFLCNGPIRNSMKQLDFTKCPDLETVKKGISILKGFNWPQFSSSEGMDHHIKVINDILCKYFYIIPNLLYVHSEDKPLPLKFFRVRPLETFIDTNLICEYSYKPIHLTTTLQRGNFPNKPVFYCSNDPATALIEVIKDSTANKQSKFLISCWSIIRHERTKIIPFLFSDLPSRNDYELFGKWANDRMPTIFNGKLSDSQLEGQKAYLDFLASTFLTNNYSLSATLVHSMLYAPHNYAADIFIYPSVRTELKSINMAIHPNFVDNNMRLDRVYSVSVSSINIKPGSINVVIDSYAELDFEAIIWNDINQNDEKYQAYVRSDFSYDKDFKFNLNKNKSIY